MTIVAEDIKKIISEEMLLFDNFLNCLLFEAPGGH